MLVQTLYLLSQQIARGHHLIRRRIDNESCPGARVPIDIEKGATLGIGTGLHVAHILPHQTDQIGINIEGMPRAGELTADHAVAVLCVPIGTLGMIDLEAHIRKVVGGVGMSVE